MLSLKVSTRMYTSGKAATRSRETTNLAAEHGGCCRRQAGGALEAAVAHELFHGGDVDVPLLRAGVHPGGVYVDAHDVLRDASVAFLIPDRHHHNSRTTQQQNGNRAKKNVDRSTHRPDTYHIILTRLEASK